MKTWKIDFMPDLKHVRISTERELRVGSYYDYVGTFTLEKAAFYLLIETTDEDIASKLADRFVSIHLYPFREAINLIIDSNTISNWIGKQLAAMV